jgi:hypothetical protein
VLPLLQQRSVCCCCYSKGVCVAAVVVKECVLPLLRQRSVCCRCYSKGVCVATIAAKEQSESCSKRNCVPAIPTMDILEAFKCLKSWYKIKAFRGESKWWEEIFSEEPQKISEKGVY